MIKPEELRIGNLIDYKGNYSNYKGLTALTPHLFSYLLEVDNEWELITPVTLNAGLFMELGFQRLVDVDIPDIFQIQCYNANLTFCISKIDFLYRYGFNSLSNHCFIHFKYVHQFQNLFFSITREELTVSG